MAICQFYLRGQCKFGNNCRNEHPAQRPSGFGTSWTGSSSNTGAANNKTVAFTVDSVTKDFTAGVDKPLWPLSSYGPSKYEPNVISNLDESPEELRVKAMQALRAGNAMEYQKYEAEKIAASEQMYSSALNNAKEVYQRAFDQSGGASDSPYAPKLSSFGSPSAQSAFSSNSNSAFAKPASGFGAFSGATSAFGKPAFGQSAFGQSGFGQTQPSTSAFGNTTAPTNSVFGQPSAPSAFGQTTAPAFGQTNQPQSAFGKPVSAFGSTTPAVGFSAFANSPSTTANSSGGGFSAFAGAGNSAFGSPAAASTGNSVFGKPAFAAPSAFGGGDTNKSPFGPTPAAPSAFAPANSNASVFGTPTAPASAFGNTTTSSPFGATNNASPFGQANNSAPSPFGQANNSAPSAFGTPQPLTSAFGNPNPSSFSAFGNSAPLNSNSSLSPFSSSNEQAKIGPPDFAKAMATVKAVPGKDKYDALLPPNYAQLLPAAAREAFEAPKFEWGKIPDFVPPVQFR